MRTTFVASMGHAAEGFMPSLLAPLESPGIHIALAIGTLRVGSGRPVGETLLATIVAEAVLEESLVGVVKEVGATGYTLSAARGEGSRGRRLGEIPGDSVRLGLVGALAAEAILDLLAVRFFANCAVVAWGTEVHVRRGEKYR